MKKHDFPNNRFHVSPTEVAGAVVMIVVVLMLLKVMGVFR